MIECQIHLSRNWYYTRDQEYIITQGEYHTRYTSMHIVAFVQGPRDDLYNTILYIVWYPISLFLQWQVL